MRKIIISGDSSEGRPFKIETEVDDQELEQLKQFTSDREEEYRRKDGKLLSLSRLEVYNYCMSYFEYDNVPDGFRLLDSLVQPDFFVSSVEIV